MKFHTIAISSPNGVCNFFSVEIKAHSPHFNIWPLRSMDTRKQVYLWMKEHCQQKTMYHDENNHIRFIHYEDAALFYFTFCG